MRRHAPLCTLELVGRSSVVTLFRMPIGAKIRSSAVAVLSTVTVASLASDAPSFAGTRIRVAAIAAGAPDIGMAMIVGAQGVAQRELLAFSRVQESSADQAGVKYLTATGQSAKGMLAVFNKFADQEALSGNRQDPFVRTHPLSRDRLAALEQMVAASPFRDRPDSK